MNEPKQEAALLMLGRMLTGIMHGPAFDPMRPGPAGVIGPDGDGVTAIVQLPSGDTYKVTVEWLAEESP